MLLACFIIGRIFPWPFDQIFINPSSFPLLFWHNYLHYSLPSCNLKLTKKGLEKFIRIFCCLWCSFLLFLDHRMGPVGCSWRLWMWSYWECEDYECEDPWGVPIFKLIFLYKRTAARWIAKLSSPFLLKALNEFPDYQVKVYVTTDLTGLFFFLNHFSLCLKLYMS